MTRLHTLTVGTAGPRIAFCHGLFGQGRNWAQIAKGVSGPDGTDALCLLIDLPDHGRSPWSSEFSYPAYAAALAAALERAGGATPWTLVGHSLGGKVAMMTALAHSDYVERLVIVDIAPKGYGNLHRFAGYIAAMQTLPLDVLTSREEADDRLAAVEPDAGIRAFLLQNLRRDGEGWRWQVNLDLIAADAARGEDSRIAAFPEQAGDHRPYLGPVMWVAGARSPYIQDGDEHPMRALFPRVRKLTVKDAGHWVHTDQPEITVTVLRSLLAQPIVEGP